jgi:2-methylcitrate dehydratase PrpD
MTTLTPNAAALADFVVGMRQRSLPPEVEAAARMCLVDWLGVAIAARDEGAARAVRTVVAGWGSGDAHVLFAPAASAAGAALVNGTMAHCLDFDDTHVGSLAHLSGPSWAAALALGTARKATPDAMIRAFLAGFETGGRLGNGGVGDALNERGLHSTGFIGCVAAAATSSAVLMLDQDGVARTLGAAATQAAGLTASFGTMAKPFHAGKAAFNGVLSAELAAAGFVPAPDLLEPEGGLASALIQDGRTRLPPVTSEMAREVLRNSFKPYASCLLTHPVIDAARELARGLDVTRVERVGVGVHPMAVQLAGKPSPATPLEGKFSIAFCAALGLSGRSASYGDFTPARLSDPALRALLPRVELVTVSDMAKTAAWMEVLMADGTRRRADIALALGNPERPLSWDDMQSKFTGLVEPALGRDAVRLFGAARRFATGDDLAAIVQLTRPASRVAAVA